VGSQAILGTYREEELPPEATMSIEHIEAYRNDCNHIRPHEASPGASPLTSTPTTPTRPSPTSEQKKSCQQLDAGLP